VALVGLWVLLLSALAALLVSSLARDSSTSLGILVWLWVTVVLVVPAVGGLLARRLHSIPAEGETAREMAAIDQRISREHAGQDRQWRPLQWAAADGFAWERTSAQAETRRFGLKEEVRRRVLQRKLGQARLAQALACLSPASLAGDVAEAAGGHGPGARRELSRSGLGVSPGARPLAARPRRPGCGKPAHPFLQWLCVTQILDGTGPALHLPRGNNRSGTGDGAAQHLDPRRRDAGARRRGALLLLPQRGELMIEAIDLSKRYSNGKLALDALNLRVAAGEIYCLLGAKGAGKTTAIDLFLGFAEPTAGKARIAGVDVAREPLKAKAQVAYLADTTTFYRRLTPLQNLDFFARLGGPAPSQPSGLRDGPARGRPYRSPRSGSASRSSAPAARASWASRRP